MASFFQSTVCLRFDHADAVVAADSLAFPDPVPRCEYAIIESFRGGAILDYFLKAFLFICVDCFACDLHVCRFLGL